VSDRLPLFELTNTVRRDVVDAIAKAFELGYAEGFAKGFAEGGIAASEQVKEQVAQWMIAQSYATGHGDTTEDMLRELEWQAKERVDVKTLMQRRFTLDDLRKVDEIDQRAKEGEK